MEAICRSGDVTWHGLCLTSRRLIFNGALLRSLPRLIHSTPERSFTVQVLYWRGDRPPIAGVKEGFRKRIVELGGDDCRERTDNGFTNVEWSKKSS